MIIRPHPKFKGTILTGRRFGRFLVVKFLGRREHGNDAVWECKCACGTVRPVLATSLMTGRTVSCGCWIIDERTKHGFAAADHPLHKVYRVWQSMRRRCDLETVQAYPRYGGRGIFVCERWEKFENFWRDMGPTYKEGLTIERKNNDVGYSKENCTWADRITQGNNKRNNVRITFLGRTMTVRGWSDYRHIPRSRILDRISKGWPPSMVLSAKKFTRWDTL